MPDVVFKDNPLGKDGFEVKLTTSPEYVGIF
jgi:hypothetical protein